LDSLYLIYTYNSGLQVITALSLFYILFQFTVTHAQGFSVVTSRVLVTDLSQSHWHFNSHMESFPSLITFDFHLQNSAQFSSDYFTSRLLCSTPTAWLLLLFKRPSLSLYNPLARTPRKTSSSVKNVCLLVPYLATDVLLLSAFVAGICLRTCCLAMSIYVIVFKF
jgi:hypothetical protein